LPQKTTHIYEVHAKSPKSKGKWRVVEVHDDEPAALRAANIYATGAEKTKVKGFSVKVVKIERSETPVSERLISKSTPVKSTKPKTNLDKMVSTTAKPNSRRPTDAKPRKKPVEGKLDVPAKPIKTSGPITAPKRGR
jgi:hypothetical protein